MKTIPFDIKFRPEIEAGEKRVVTRKEHFPARIICWDRKERPCPIIALIDDGRIELLVSLYENGNQFEGSWSDFDLLIVDDSFTPFEERLYDLFSMSRPETSDEFEAWIHEQADGLLNIARADFKSDFIDEASSWVEFEYGADASDIFKGYMEGQS